MKKKKTAVLFSLLYALALGLLAGYFAGTLYYAGLKRIPFSRSIFAPKNVLTSLQADSLYRLVFLLFSVSATLVVLSVMLLGGKKGYRSQMVTLTPDITVPAPAGQMQHGSARFLKPPEYKRILSAASIDHCEPLIQQLMDLGRQDQALKAVDRLEAVKEPPLKNPPQGIPVGYERTGKKLERLWTIQGDVHTLVIGATRSGKTRTVVLQSIVGDALAGKDMFLSDPKGELYQYTYPLLQRLGYHICVLDFKDPELSQKYNFLQAIIDHLAEKNIPKAISAAWDVVDSFVKETSQDPIWGNGEKAIMASAIMIVCYENSTLGIQSNHPDWTVAQAAKEYRDHGRWHQNLANVYYFVSQMLKPSPFDQKRMVLQDFIDLLPEDHPARLMMATAESSPDDTRGSFIASALSTLRLFTDPNIASMTNDTYRPIFDPDLKKAIFIILPDEKQTYYQLAAMITNQYYQFLASEADKQGGRLERDFEFKLDEFGNFSTIPGFDNKMTVAAGRGIHFALYIQSMEQLEVRYKKEVAGIITGNCHYWVYLRSPNQATREQLSKKLGSYTVMATSESSSVNKSDGSWSSSASLTSRPLLTADEIERINRPYLLVCVDGFNALMESPDISQWSYNQMLGLGDPGHNRTLRVLRQAARPRHTVQPVKLWDYQRHLLLLSGQVEDKPEPDKPDLSSRIAEIFRLE